MISTANIAKFFPRYHLFFIFIFFFRFVNVKLLAPAVKLCMQVYLKLRNCIIRWI